MSLILALGIMVLLPPKWAFAIESASVDCG